NFVTRVAFSPDGTRLASSSRDGTVKIWDATTGQEVHTLKGRPHYVAALAFSADGKRLATVSGDGPAIWDPATGEKVVTLPGGHSDATFLVFSADGTHLTIGGVSDQVSFLRVFDTSTGRLAKTLNGPPNGVHGASLSPDGRRLAVLGRDGTLTVRDTATDQEVVSRKGQALWAWGLTYSPDGGLLAAGVDRAV